MLKNERQQEIIDILEVSKKVITKELVSHFNVSEDTIRRDLKELEDLNRLKEYIAEPFALDQLLLTLTIELP